MKQFLGYVVLITLIVGSICGIVFGIMFGVKNKQFEESNNPAIIEEYKEKLSDFELQVNGLNSKLAVEIAENEKHEKTIESLNISIQQKNTEIKSLETDKTLLENSVFEKQAKIEELNSKIRELETDTTNNLVEIEALKNQKENLETEKATLQNQLTEKETQITTLQSEKSSLTIELEQVKIDLTNSQSNIISLNTQITNLQNEITSLSAELQAYKDMELTNVFKLEFKNGDVTEAVVYVNEGEMLPYVPVLKNTQDTWYYGWNINENQTVAMDLSSYVPTADTTFFVVKSDCVNVRLQNTNLNLNDPEFYRYGKYLKVKDVLQFNSDIDLNDENLNLSIWAGALDYMVEQPTLNTVITDLPYSYIGPRYQVDKQWGRVRGYILDYTLTYNYDSVRYGIHDRDNLLLLDRIKIGNLSYHNGFVDFKAYIKVEETTYELGLPENVTSTTSTSTYTFENVVSGLNVTFGIRNNPAYMNWGVISTTYCVFSFTCKLNLNVLYCSSLKTAEEIDMHLYIEITEE